VSDPGDVAARPCEVCDEADLDRIGNLREQNTIGSERVC
jgi:hypothetical protein